MAREERDFQLLLQQADLAAERGLGDAQALNRLVQSSGVGNCVNTLCLVACARFPLLKVVTMHGDWAEFNQWQDLMGHAAEAALRLMGVLTWRADEPAAVAPLLRGAATMVIFNNGHFGETGMQRSHAGFGLEFTRVAEACGFPGVYLVTKRQGMEPLRRRIHAKQGLNLAVVKIEAVNAARVLPPRDGVHVKNRFPMALGHRPS